MAIFLCFPKERSKKENKRGKTKSTKVEKHITYTPLKNIHFYDFYIMLTLD